jgi:hypothetical protein
MGSETFNTKRKRSGSSWTVNTAKSRAIRRKVRPITDVASTALGKDEMAVEGAR